MSYHRKLVLYYLILIAIGTVLLSLPFSKNHNVNISIIDTLFTSVSAVCVTGLITVDTGTTWSIFGKIILMILIQFGGIGLLVILTYLNTIITNKIRLGQRLLTQEELNCCSVTTFEDKIKHIIIHTIIIEFIGTIILSTQFIPIYGINKGIFFSVFHSISAFCNAGFDLIGNFQSFTGFRNNPVILYTILVLTIIGGIGFICIENILSWIRRKVSLTYNTKVVIYTSSFILFTSFILFCVAEWNSYALEGLNSFDKINNIAFMTGIPRTAGFNSIDLNLLNTSSKLLTIVLMFIGGASGSTAGGIKVTTVAIIISAVYSNIKRRNFVHFLHRRIKRNIIDTSYSIFVLSFLIVIGLLYLLTLSEFEKNFITLLFEIVSAFGTVGLSLGITPSLSIFGKFIIMILMFIGRIGPITLGTSLINKKKTRILYPEGNVMVG